MKTWQPYHRPRRLTTCSPATPPWKRPGYAIRTADHRVFFIDADAQCTQLDNSYRPHLVLLGDVNLSERQQVLDRVAGGYAAVACSRDEGGRKMSPPPSPRIAPRFAPWWRTSRPRPRRSCPLRSTAASRPPSSWCWRTISRRTRMARPRWAAVTRSRCVPPRGYHVRLSGLHPRPGPRGMVSA